MPRCASFDHPYLSLKEPDKAEKYFNLSLPLSLESKNNEAIGRGIIHLAWWPSPAMTEKKHLFNIYMALIELKMITGNNQEAHQYQVRYYKARRQCLYAFDLKRRAAVQTYISSQALGEPANLCKEQKDICFLQMSEIGVSVRGAQL